MRCRFVDDVVPLVMIGIVLVLVCSFQAEVEIVEGFRVKEEIFRGLGSNVIMPGGCAGAFAAEALFGAEVADGVWGEEPVLSVAAGRLFDGVVQFLENVFPECAEAVVERLVSFDREDRSP